MTSARETLLLAATLLLAGLLYSVSLHGPFFYDDAGHIVRNANLHDLRHPFRVIFNGTRQTRVLMNLSFAWDWTVSNGETWSFHLTNILIHLACGVLVFTWMRRVFPSAPAAVWATTILFLFHPLQSEPVSYIMARSTLLGAFGTLLCLGLALSSRTPLPVLFFALIFSLFCKETGALNPILLFLQDFLIIQKGKWRGIDRSRIALYVGVLLAAALLAAAFRGHNGNMYDDVVGFRLFPWGQFVVTQGYYYLYYIYLLFFSASQSPIHEYPAFNGTLCVLGVVGLILCLSVMLFAIRSMKTRPTASFLIFMFFLYLAPTNSILQMVNPFAEYRLYLSNFCLFAALGVAFSRLWARFRHVFLKRALVIGMLALIWGATLMRERLWANDLALVSYSLDENAGSYELHILLGTAYEHRGGLASAEAEFKKALELTRGRRAFDRFPPSLLLATLYLRQGRTADMVQVLSEIPDSIARDHPPIEYFTLYLFALRQLGDRTGFARVLGLGSGYYPRELLLRKAGGE